VNEKTTQNCAPRIVEQTSTDVTVENFREIDITSVIQDGRLLLEFQGTVLGDVTDVFCGGSPAPSTMTLFIADVSTPSEEVQAWWTPEGIDHWQPFSRGTGGVSQVFTVPPLNQSSRYKFRAQVVGTTLVDDPKLIIHVQTQC